MSIDISQLPVPNISPNQMEAYLARIQLRQQWLQRNANLIKLISRFKYFVLSNIYLHPVLLDFIKITQQSTTHRRRNLVKTLSIYMSLVTKYCNGRIDILDGLPPINYLNERQRPLRVREAPPPPYTRTDDSTIGDRPSQTLNATYV